VPAVRAAAEVHFIKRIMMPFETPFKRIVMFLKAGIEFIPGLFLLKLGFEIFAA
jgi:hypothetical protein